VRDEKRKNSSTQVKIGGERERKSIGSFTIFFGVWNELNDLPIYRKKSQLICEKLWEQVIHILDLV